MLPDPSSLRSVAVALGAWAGDLRGRCVAVAGTCEDLRWSGPVVDGVRRRLAEAQAQALSGCAGLEAGAAHLRQLALAVEETERAARRLHAAAVEDLHRQQAGAAAPLLPLGAAAAGLPPPADPTWAQRAGTQPVALPPLPRVAPAPVAPGPPGRVEAELAGVRRLVRTGVAAAEEARTVRGQAVARVTGLALERADPYGLGGSRSAAWLVEACAPLVAAGGGWEEAGRTAACLVELLERADRPGELLTDPRLSRALGVLGALREGRPPDLAGVPADDLAWLQRVVPGLAGRPVGTVPFFALPGPTDWADGLNGLWQAPTSAAEQLRQRVAALARHARQLRSEARRQTGLTAVATRQAARQALREARALRDQARGVERWRLPVPSWLRRLTTTPVLDAPGVRAVSRLGALGAVTGAGLEVRGGTPVPLALTKAAGGLAGGVGGAALAGVLLAGGPVLLVGAGSVAGAFAAGWATSTAVGHLAPVAWQGVGRAGRGAAQAVGAAGRGIGRLAGALGGGVARAVGARAQPSAAGAAPTRTVGRERGW